ncbi:hypothetical protein AHAS_Ahas16G0208900 [Arachis hypogaea]
MREHSTLLSALVKRWKPETHTFHLPIGEVATILKNMTHTFVLPVNREPVMGKTDNGR